MTQTQFICNLTQEETDRIKGLFEMSSALNSLVLQIAENNDILESDSTFYARLVSDYKDNQVSLQKFWDFYLKEYSGMLDKDSQFVVDFHNKAICKIPKNASVVA